MLWYMQLGWPDRFGLSKDQGRELLARFKNVVQAFSITNESEGAIGNMTASWRTWMLDTASKWGVSAGGDFPSLKLGIGTAFNKKRVFQACGRFQN